MGERERRPAGQHRLAVLGAAPAGAVEGEGPGRLVDRPPEDQPGERVRREVAGPVGGAAEPGQPVLFVGVEQLEQAGRGFRGDGGGPPHIAGRAGRHPAMVTRPRRWSPGA